MRIFSIISAIAAFGVGLMGIASMRSDIQLTIAFIGVFSGIILLGQAAILGRLKQ